MRKLILICAIAALAYAAALDQPVMILSEGSARAPVHVVDVVVGCGRGADGRMSCAAGGGSGTRGAGGGGGGSLSGSAVCATVIDNGRGQGQAVFTPCLGVSSMSTVSYVGGGGGGPAR